MRQDLPAVDRLNRNCFCVGLDGAALSRALAVPDESLDLDAMVRERCPHAFAARPVFVSDEDLARMADVVSAVDTVVELPAWQERALAHAPPIARFEPRASRGVFMGFDFHLNAGRLGLIEINTNAGGAMLNVVATRAQAACCPPIEALLHPPREVDAFEHDVVDMFRREWALADMGRPLGRIAIVDQAPREQYLYPEFLLFRRLFERRGLEAAVVDPGGLRFVDGVLRDAAGRIDLVYNRLTDFELSGPDVAAVREAYLAGGSYVAQETVAPGERRIGDLDGAALKFDLRNYAYEGRVQWVAARLYQGQTTNFRTPGGGFAPVYRAGTTLQGPKVGVRE